MLYKDNSKIYEFYYKQPREKSIKPGLPLVFIDSVHFLNNLLDNLVKTLGEMSFII